MCHYPSMCINHDIASARLNAPGATIRVCAINRETTVVDFTIYYCVLCYKKVPKIIDSIIHTYIPGNKYLTVPLCECRSRCHASIPSHLPVQDYIIALESHHKKVLHN